MECTTCGEALDPVSTFRCSGCRDPFCSAHRLPESHDCVFGVPTDSPWGFKLTEETKYGYTAHRDRSASGSARSKSTAQAVREGIARAQSEESEVERWRRKRRGDSEDGAGTTRADTRDSGEDGGPRRLRRLLDALRPWR